MINNHKRLSLCAIAAALLLCAPAMAQETVWVDDDTCPATGTGTVGDPFCKIQDGICDIKLVGGTVMVMPGYYNESLRMFQNISVVSTDGPLVTTIDADGKPCTTSACVDSLINLTCSTVVYGSGPTPADRLEGFRITGGSGLYRSPAGASTDALVGGAIFVWNSSPTITNNEIIDNTLLNANETRQFWGGAIYLGGGSMSTPRSPVITNNLIQENLADPPQGQNQSHFTYGSGGGIYIGQYTAPVIQGNTIRSNRAGDTNKLNQLGGGGGLVVYSISPALAPQISQNLIQDNVSSDWGGGISFSQVYSGETYWPSYGLVENNVFELNRSFTGGALHTATTNAVIRSNTFADNTAEFGGGITVGQSVIFENQARLINNIIAFNTSLLYSAGGMGVYYSDPESSVSTAMYRSIRCS
jgi:hypothetical protein